MLDQRKKRGTNGLGENNLGFRIKKMGTYSTEVRRMRCSESSVFPETAVFGCWREGRRGCTASEESG